MGKTKENKNQKQLAILLGIIILIIVAQSWIRSVSEKVEKTSDININQYDTFADFRDHANKRLHLVADIHISSHEAELILWSIDQKDQDKELFITIFDENEEDLRTDFLQKVSNNLASIDRESYHGMKYYNHEEASQLDLPGVVIATGYELDTTSFIAQRVLIDKILYALDSTRIIRFEYL